MELETAKAGASDEALVKEAISIVDEARRRGIVLRSAGAVAIRIHCKSFTDLHVRLKRLGNVKSQFSDLDLVAYGTQRSPVHRLLTNGLGYVADRLVMAYFGDSRFLYHHPQGLWDVDVFFDKLQFSHDLFLGSKLRSGRLELDYPTIPLADLLLEKLQIHEINEKDIKDVIVLLREHEIGESEGETVNAKYVARVLGGDWGFWYDARTNLEKVVEFSRKYRELGLLGVADEEVILSRIRRILEAVDAEPKSAQWMKRAKNGTRKKWWRDVEELIR